MHVPGNKYRLGGCYLGGLAARLASRDPKVEGGTALGACALGQFLVIYQGNGKLNLDFSDSASRFPDI